MSDNSLTLTTPASSSRPSPAAEPAADSHATISRLAVRPAARESLANLLALQKSGDCATASADESTALYNRQVSQFRCLETERIQLQLNKLSIPAERSVKRRSNDRAFGYPIIPRSQKIVLPNHTSLRESRSPSQQGFEPRPVIPAAHTRRAPPSVTTTKHSHS